MAPDGSSIRTAAMALFFGAGVLADLGRGAAAHGSGSRCGTIGAVFGAASVCGRTSRTELVLAARRGDGVSVGSANGATVLPPLHAMMALASTTKISRVNMVFVT